MTDAQFLILAVSMAGLIAWAGWLIWTNERDRIRWEAERDAYEARLAGKRAEIKRLGGRVS